MARDIICDVDHVEVATWLVGDLKTGDQVGLCDDHLIAWGLAQIDTMLDEGQRLVAISKLAEKLPEPPTEEEPPIGQQAREPWFAEDPPASAEVTPEPEPKRGRRGRAAGQAPSDGPAEIAAEARTPPDPISGFEEQTPEAVESEPAAPLDG